MLTAGGGGGPRLLPDVPLGCVLRDGKPAYLKIKNLPRGTLQGETPSIRTESQK